MQRYEKILKSVLTDVDLSDYARSVLLYLASLPPGWEIHDTDIAKKMKRPLSRIKAAMRELRAAGYVEAGKPATDTTGRIYGRFGSTVNRGKILGP